MWREQFHVLRREDRRLAAFALFGLVVGSLVTAAPLVGCSIAATFIDPKPLAGLTPVVGAGLTAVCRQGRLWRQALDYGLEVIQHRPHVTAYVQCAPANRNAMEQVLVGAGLSNTHLQSLPSVPQDAAAQRGLTLRLIADRRWYNDSAECAMCDIDAAAVYFGVSPRDYHVGGIAMTKGTGTEPTTLLV
jgi:hypothetical protein